MEVYDWITFSVSTFGFGHFQNTQGSPVIMALAQLLANLTICCTGLDEEIRANVQKRTEALGGRYSAHLTKDCTHLIAGNICKSSKYKSALKFGIPVVQVAWIDECWNSAHLNSGPIEEQRRFLYQIALRKYSVAGLQGCLVSVTGVAFDERAKICSMVQELGGVYSPELKPQCSHLIYEDAAALALPEESNKSQTAPQVFQSQSQLPIKVQYALKWDIPVVSKAWIYACYAEKRLLEESDYPVLQSSLKDKLEDTSNAEILPIKLNEIHENVPSFLHGCNIYLNGDSISNQRLAVLKRLVLAAGGVRYTDLDSTALTHIVIHNQLLPNNLKSFLEHQNSLDRSVKLVHDNWLFDSYREGKRLPEDDYLVNKVTRDLSQSVAEAPVIHGNSKWKSAFATASNNASSLPNTSGIIFNNANSSFFSSNASFMNANPAANVTLNDLRGAEEFLAGTPNVLEAAEKVLKKKSVYLGDLRVDEKTKKRLVAKARKLRVKIVDNEIEADWCITDVLISTELFKKLTQRRSPSDLRNFIWFETAMDSKTHLPAMSFAHPLHCVVVPLGDLSKSVISQSGFTGAEREFYAELIRASGAQYTDSLSKANTHLVIEEPRSGTKFEFAKKWKIECINLEWFKNRFQSASNQFGKENLSNSGGGGGGAVSKSNLNSQQLSQQLNSQQQSQGGQNSLNLNLLSKARLSFQTHSQTATAGKEKNTSNLDSRGIFKGLVFASSQRLWHRRDELSSAVESLGGIFLWSFDRSCTHYLHQGKLADEAFKEFKQARQWDKFIVSPWWVLKCRESGSLMDEALFPHTYKEQATNDDLNLSEPLDGSIKTKFEEMQHQNQNQKRQQQQQLIGQENYPSASEQIDWDRILAEKKAQESLLRPGSKTFNIDLHHSTDHKMVSDNTSTQLQRIHSPLPSSAPNVKYKVLFSGFTSSERLELLNVASNRSDLQIACEDESVDWNPRQTLLICNSLNFTEKIFSACATGCWILRKDFLLQEASVITSALLEKYEIGPAWNSNERENLIGRAPRYWRMKLSMEGGEGKPFRGWKCLVMVESARQTLYESVLRNGGAVIVDPSECKNATILSHITHLFCGNVKSIPEDWRAHLRTDQIYSTKHITNTIFRLND